MRRSVSAHFDAHQFRQLRLEDGRPVLYPPGWIASRLVPLAEVLEMLWKEAGEVVILAGYWTRAEHERQMEWAEELTHTEGRAVDLAVPGMAPEDVVRVLMRMRRGGSKIGGIGLYPQFVHLDQRAGSPHFFQVQLNARHTRPMPALNPRETLCLGCGQPASRCSCQGGETE